jgi:NAD(P)H dehydrogenase (quinone)
MPKLLIIYAHPNHEGNHAYLLKEIEEELKEKNFKDYKLIDLYKEKYDPVLKDKELYSMDKREVSEENRKYQELIKEATKLIFIYPTWWQNLPAILKGFIDRVFVGGFAFRYRLGVPMPLLKGKKAAIFTASGGPHLYNKFIIRHQPIKLLSKDVLFLAGIKSKGFTLSSAKKLNDRSAKKMKKTAQDMIKYLNI